MSSSSHITLGLHIGHDRAATVLANGRLIGHLSEERVDRVKHSFSIGLPWGALQVLQSRGLFRIADIRDVGITFAAAEAERFKERWQSELEEHLGTLNAHIIPVSHHLAHAYSTFYTSPLSDALVLIADGGGDVVAGGIEAESLYHARGSTMELLEQRLQDAPVANMAHPGSHAFDVLTSAERGKQISLGRKYTQLTYTIGFGAGQEGKAMGLAAYGKPLVRPKILTDGLAFDLRFGTVLEEVEDLWRKSGESLGDYLRRYRADLAATAQELVENVVIQSVTQCVERYGITDLCLSGGLFLNCLLNHRILERTPVRRLHIIPAAGDDGQSIGAAFYAYHMQRKVPRNSTLEFPYLGPAYDKREIEAALVRWGVGYRWFSDGDLAVLMAERIAGGALVGLLRGRTEIGPRALCHRSILGDPRSQSAKSRLDSEVKHREAFRPYAPVVTAEAQLRYFDLRQSSPYMLLAASVRPEYRAQLPAITHADGTARIQAVSQAGEPFIHRLLSEFEVRTGFPILLNTSFNDAGEPIVETPEDAIATFRSTGLDMLVLENFVIEKEG
jgi:carbamoyltransferase